MEDIDTSVRKPMTYSVPEAGKQAGLGKNASYEAAKRGEIPTIKFGKLLRVPAVAWRDGLTKREDVRLATGELLRDAKPHSAEVTELAPPPHLSRQQRRAAERAARKARAA